MRVTINDVEVRVNSKDARMCRQQISQIISSVRKNAEGRDSLRYYFTFLIMMHLMSQSILNELKPETLSFIMNELVEPDD